MGERSRQGINGEPGCEGRDGKRWLFMVQASSLLSKQAAAAQRSCAHGCFGAAAAAAAMAARWCAASTARYPPLPSMIATVTPCDTTRARIKCCASALFPFLKAMSPPSSTPPVAAAPAAWGGRGGHGGGGGEQRYVSGGSSSKPQVAGCSAAKHWPQAGWHQPAKGAAPRGAGRGIGSSAGWARPVQAVAAHQPGPRGCACASAA